MSADSTKTNLTLRLQRQTGTPEANLLRYLSEGANKTANARELVFAAIRAFYLAQSCQNTQDYSLEELQQIGMQCCHLLEQQALVIRTALKLPVSTSINSAPVASPAAPALSPSPPLREVPQPSVASSKEVATSLHRGIMGSFGQ